MLTLLHTATIFLGAFLLFMVQPMAARLALPSLGGSPSVWNTCMVFFQAALLAGYAYAHVLGRLRSAKAQAVIHAAAVLAPLLVLPIALPPGFELAESQSPALMLLRLMAVMVGLPFALVATTGPLIQKWYSRTTARHAADPYFLYAASNAGSLLALLAYPLVVEPRLTLSEQAAAWRWGYLGLAALLFACAVARVRSAAPESVGVPATPDAEAEAPITTARRLRWIALAAVPSAFMLGVTQFITTDIAPIPLLWVIPLSLYLITFIVAFARRNILPPRTMSFIYAPAVVGVMLLNITGVLEPLWLVVAAHLALLFIGAMMCHGFLAADRPPPARLTEFYLWLSLGGVLGGVACSLLAPVMFNDVWEYPAALIAVCLLRPRLALWRRAGAVPTPRPARPALLLLDLALPAAAVAVTLIGFPILLRNNVSERWAWLIVGAFVPAAVCLVLLNRRVGLAAGVLALVIIAEVNRGYQTVTLVQKRSFFGVHAVKAVFNGHVHVLLHGTTRHGAQMRDAPYNLVPTGYYARSNPLGRVLRAFAAEPRMNRIAVLGMGAGTLAAYNRPERTITFYEIDPAMVETARDTNYFSYLADSRGKVDVVVGDGRLEIAKAPSSTFGLIVMDAFSSDSVPVHLLTKEAIQTYLAKLTPDGILAFNISNRTLNLLPVLAAVSKDLGLWGFAYNEWEDWITMSPERSATWGKMNRYPSRWVFLGRSQDSFQPMVKAEDTQNWFFFLTPGAMGDDPLPRVWTDDYCDVISTIKR